MEKFDLDKALQGEPVLLRNNFFAYIIGIVPNGLLVKLTNTSKNFPIIGSVIDPMDNTVIRSYVTWTIDGKYPSYSEEHSFDIIGMYTENKPL